MNQSGRGMTQRVVELAEVMVHLKQAEADIEYWHATGAQPAPGVPSLAFMEAALEVSKDTYRQQLRVLSQEEMCALDRLIN
jgi:hypothetical protein